MYFSRDTKKKRKHCLRHYEVRIKDSTVKDNDNLIELAKLRREQKKIAKEDKFDAAALVLGIAKQQEATRETRYDVVYMCFLLSGFTLPPHLHRYAAPPTMSTCLL